MRKVLLLLCFILIQSRLFAQTVRATLVNTAAEQVKAFAKPSVDLTNTLFRSITITMSIPDQGVGNPTVTVSTNYVNNLTWVADVGNPIIYKSRAYYNFIGSDNGLLTTTSWIAS